MVTAESVSIDRNVTISIGESLIGIGFNGSAEKFFDKSVVTTHSFVQSFSRDVACAPDVLTAEIIGNLSRNFSDRMTLLENFTIASRENTVDRVRSAVQSACNFEDMQLRFERSITENLIPKAENVAVLEAQIARAEQNYTLCVSNLNHTARDLSGVQSERDTWMYFSFGTIILTLILAYLQFVHRGKLFGSGGFKQAPVVYSPQPRLRGTNLEEYK